MQKEIIIKYIVLVLIAVSIFVLVFLILKEQVTKSGVPEEEIFSSSNSYAFWIERIEKIGAINTYEEFKAANNKFSINIQHTNAHVFGEALFIGAGLNGVFACDTSFSFGCYHEFLGQAIQAHGIEIAYELNDVCANSLDNRVATLACQHGVGHGVLSYFGYTTDSLNNSLDICTNLPHNDSIGGCYGGVFMEYNMHTMLAEGGVGGRQLMEKEGLHFPCNIVNGGLAHVCYYWQPQWWLSVLYGNSEEKFKLMGEYCNNLDTELLVTTCLDGIGNIAPQSAGYSPEKTISLCKLATVNKQQELHCRATAADVFNVIPNVSNLASDVCEGLEPEDKNICLKYNNGVSAQSS